MEEQWLLEGLTCVFGSLWKYNEKNKKYCLEMSVYNLWILEKLLACLKEKWNFISDNVNYN